MIFILKMFESKLPLLFKYKTVLGIHQVECTCKQACFDLGDLIKIIFSFRHSKLEVVI